MKFFLMCGIALSVIPFVACDDEKSDGGGYTASKS